MNELFFENNVNETFIYNPMFLGSAEVWLYKSRLPIVQKQILHEKDVIPWLQRAPPLHLGQQPCGGLRFLYDWHSKEFDRTIYCGKPTFDAILAHFQLPRALLKAMGHNSVPRFVKLEPSTHNDNEVQQNFIFRVPSSHAAAWTLGITYRDSTNVTCAFLHALYGEGEHDQQPEGSRLVDLVTQMAQYTHYPILLPVLLLQIRIETIEDQIKQMLHLVQDLERQSGFNRHASKKFVNGWTPDSPQILFALNNLSLRRVFWASTLLSYNKMIFKILNFGEKLDASRSIACAWPAHRIMGEHLEHLLLVNECANIEMKEIEKKTSLLLQFTYHCIARMNTSPQIMTPLSA